MEVIIFLGIFVLVVTYLIHVEMYFRKLRQSFPDVYEELGSPSVIGKNQNALRMIRFFTSKKYKQLEDPHLVRMGNQLVIHFCITLISMISFFSYMILSGQL